MQPVVDLCATALRRSSEGRTAQAFFNSALRTLRKHMATEVAFVSQFSNGQRYFLYRDSVPGNAMAPVGASDPLEETLCQRVVDGRLPELMLDAATIDEALRVLAVKPFRVGAHLSVPITLWDGTVFGTLCCFSSYPDYSLNDRDLAMMRAFADVMAEIIERGLEKSALMQGAMDRIQAVMRSNEVSTDYQPILDLADGEVIGFEAFPRFGAHPSRSAQDWFAEAASVDLGAELEAHCLVKALRALETLPPEQYVAMNVSPATILSGYLQDALHGVCASRVVIGITEHAFVEQYGAVLDAARPLQATGVRFALDGAGAGYTSFRHVLSLAPYAVKLDADVIADIDTDASRRALAAAWSGFAQETSCRLAATGVQTAAELDVLRRVGFGLAQGELFGARMPLRQARRFAPRQGV